MSFEENYAYSYTKYQKHFDKLCENSSAILGNIVQCGIIEVCKSGHILVATNRPEYGELFVQNKVYNLDPMLAYSAHIPDGFSAVTGTEDFEYMWGDQKDFFGRVFNIIHGFYYTEKVDEETYRHYFFASDERQIYNTLIRNTSLVKNFVMHFKEANRDIFNKMQDRKIDLSKEKENYFTHLKFPLKTDKERLIAFLHTLNLLSKNETLTDREFQCIKYYYQGRTSKAVGQILHISPRTVESHIDSIKSKLNVHSREELLEKSRIN